MTTGEWTDGWRSASPPTNTMAIGHQGIWGELVDELAMARIRATVAAAE